MTTELVLLGTAGAPMPVAGRAGISSALIVEDRVFVIDCGRGSPSAFVDAGLDFTRLEAVRRRPTRTDPRLRAVATRRVAGR